MIQDEMYGYMVGIQGNSLVEVPLEEVAKGQRQIPHDDPLIQTARAVGTCVGDI
jgi:6-phosphofructokinase 1